MQSVQEATQELKLMTLNDGTTVPIETDADLPLASASEPIEGKKPDYSNRHKYLSKGWSEMDKAYLLKHWRTGTGNTIAELQRDVARNLGRTSGACGQQYRMLMSGGHQAGVQSSTPKQRMVGAHSENLTFAEQKEILDLFGSFTPEIRAIILALRGYKKPKILFFDYEAHKMEVEFYDPNK